MHEDTVTDKMWKYIMLQVEFFQHPKSGRNMQLRLHSLCDYISVTFTVIPLTFMVREIMVNVQEHTYNTNSITNYFTLFPSFYFGWQHNFPRITILFPIR